MVVLARNLLLFALALASPARASIWQCLTTFRLVHGFIQMGKLLAVPAKLKANGIDPEKLTFKMVKEDNQYVVDVYLPGNDLAANLTLTEGPDWAQVSNVQVHEHHHVGLATFLYFAFAKYFYDRGKTKFYQSGYLLPEGRRMWRGFQANGYAAYMGVLPRMALKSQILQNDALEPWAELISHHTEGGKFITPPTSSSDKP